MNQASELACCAICNQQTHRRCGRCLDIYYCSTDHQRVDWRRHKSECLPKLTKPESKKEIGKSPTTKEVPKPEESRNTEESTKNEVTKPEVSARKSRKSKKKRSKKEGCDSSDKQISQDHCEQSDSASGSPGPSQAGSSKEGSVISSVVHVYRDSNKDSAITYEGSSEQQILSESAQQLSALEFATGSSANVLRTVNRTDVKMPALPETIRKEYPEASLKGTEAPFNANAGSYFMNPSDSFYEICQQVIRDMTQYGVCVLDNFLGKERGLLVLNEVLQMYRSGIFTAGQLVSNSKDAQTIRSDRITWIDGKEPNCFHIRQLISQVDNIVLSANKMANNGKMGEYMINGRTKAMVACYPGSGSHYVKHVDNPNKDGRCITAIYYLNLDWDVKRCGGLLRVFPEGTNQVANIAPIFDRMLFFWSDRRNPHEVQPAYGTRYAITLWYFDAQERAEARRHFGCSSMAMQSYLRRSRRGIRGPRLGQKLADCHLSLFDKNDEENRNAALEIVNAACSGEGSREAGWEERALAAAARELELIVSYGSLGPVVVVVELSPTRPEVALPGESRAAAAAAALSFLQCALAAAARRTPSLPTTPTTEARQI